MVIGIDIDETITNTHEAAEKYILKYAPELINEDYCEIKSEKMQKFLDTHITDIQSNLTLKKGVKEAIDRLVSHGCKIVIITARGYNLDYDYQTLSEKVLKENDIHYDEIYYKQHDKGSIASKAKVDYFIDDKESVLDEVSTFNIKTIYYVPDKSKVTSKHLVFDDWQEIADYIIKAGEENGRKSNHNWRITKW